jgi:cobalt-zinc-cadmium efflux system outer membrane protein
MIRKKLIMWCAGAIVALSPFVSHATEKASSLTLQEAIERTLAYSPDVKRVDAELAERYAEAFEAEALNNPEAEFNAAFVDGSTPSNDLELEQPLRLSDFGSRGDYADALKRVGNLEKKIELLRVINATTELYYDYWLLQEQERYLSSSEAQVKKVLKQVKQAADSGELAAADSGIFKAEALRLSEELRNVRNQRRGLQATLLQRLNMEWQERLNVAEPTMKAVPPSAAMLLEYAKSNDTIRNVLAARKDAAKARYEVAKQDAIMPELAPRFLYKRSPDGNKEGVGFGVRLSIPLWNRNEAEVGRARSQLSLAETELAVFDKLDLENIIKALHAQALDSQTRAMNYRNDILPSYEKSYGLTKQMFDAGQSSILDLWQVRERINSIQENTLEALSDSIKARLALEEAIGAKLEEIQ